MSRPMKHSGVDWLGDIPADWKVTRIKHLCNNEKNSFQDGDWIESPFITEEGIRYLTTGNVGDGIFKRQGSGHISEDTFAELNCKYAYPNDLVISRLNAPYGRACILPSDEDKYVLAVDIVILRTDHDKRYLCYLMQCQGYQNSVQDAAKGTTMKRISRTNLGNIYLPIPPLDEQQRIANFLDDKCVRIDSVIEKTRASIDEYKKLKQAVITRAVTRGIRPARPTKFSGVDWLGEVPDDWEIVPIKYLCSYNDEVLQEDTEADFAFDYIEIGSVEFGRGIINRQHIRFADAPSRARRIVQENDIIVSTVRTYLKAVASIPRSEAPLIVSTGFVVIRPKNMNPVFMRYAILSNAIISKIEANSVGISYPAINASQVVRFKVPCPPLDEQKEIAAYLDEKTAAIDSLIAKKNQLASELERLKKSLIFEYVTGKKELAQ